MTGQMRVGAWGMLGALAIAACGSTAAPARSRGAPDAGAGGEVSVDPASAGGAGGEGGDAASGRAPTSGGASAGASSEGAAGGGCDANECEPPEQVCEPGSAWCEGNVATTCSADGTGPEPAGRDCEVDGEVCEDGACAPVLCAPDARFCIDGRSYQCSERGGKRELIEECSSNEFCEATSGRCVRKACEESTAVCTSSTSRAVCNGFGTGFEPDSVEDCAESNQLCDRGECVPLVCEPSRTFCLGSGVYECDSVGGSYWKTGSCDVYGPGAHCALHPTEQDVAYCSSVYCAAGEQVCDGNTRRICNSQGTDYLPGGVDCGGGHTCRNGECLTKVCIGVLSCKDNSVINCLDEGLDYVVVEECGKDRYCARPDAGFIGCAEE